MAATGRAVHSELLKLKRTLAFRLIFVAPLLVALLVFFVQSSALSRGAGPTARNLWDNLSGESLGVWAIFLMPLLIALETALLAGIEHSEKQWKHLFALPIPRFSLFGAKYLVTQAIALMSTLVLCVTVGASGYLLMAIFPALRAAGPPLLGLILTRAVCCWLGAGLIVSAHLWIALRWPSFTVALGAGVAGTFFALFAASASIGKFYPWLLPVNAFNPKTPDRIATALWLGIGGGLLLAVAASVDFVRREESASPGLTKKSMAVWLAIVAGFAGLAMLLQKDAAPKLTDRIHRVESGLVGTLTMNGAAPKAWTLAERMKQYGVPGVSVAVIHHGQMEWAKGYGVKQAGQADPVTTRTRFQAASMSKPLTAMAALELVQQGVLSLDEDVNLRLKRWKLPPSDFTAKEKVTLRRLLNHSAGLAANETEGYAAAEAMPSLPELLRAQLRFDGEPGRRFQYANMGYALVQQLLEDATGRAYPQLMQELVLSKIGMKDSAFAQPPAADWAAECARGHKPGAMVYDGGWRNHPDMGAAGLWSTPSDLAQFVIEVQKEVRGEQSRVLNRQMAKLMTTRLMGEYGLGLQITERGFQHGGATPGYRGWLAGYTDSGDGIVAMTNGDGGAVLLVELLRSASKEYGWDGPRQASRKAIALDAAQLPAFAGRYEGKGSVLVVSVDAGKLWMGSPAVDGERWELVAVGTDRFLLVEENEEVEFRRDANGAVVEMRVATQGGETLTAKRVGG